MKSFKHKILFVFLLPFLLLANALSCSAFGISPPYIYNDSLVTGIRYEQQISLSRQDDSLDDRVELQLNAPGYESWISFEPGMSFLFPKGQKHMYLRAVVQVPKDASYGARTGTVAISISSEKDRITGGSNVVLGAQVDINLNVTDKKIYDFKVYSLDVPDSYQGEPVFTAIGIQNLGNMDFGPSRIVFEAFNALGNESIASSEVAVNIPTAGPFERKEIKVKIPSIKLPQGGYWANVQTFKGQEKVDERKLFFNVLGPRPEPLKSWDDESPQSLAQAREYMMYKIGFLVLLSILLVIIIVVLVNKIKDRKKNIIPEEIQPAKPEIKKIVKTEESVIKKPTKPRAPRKPKPVSFPQENNPPEP